jgi:hypothetical protein
MDTAWSPPEAMDQVKKWELGLKTTVDSAEEARQTPHLKTKLTQSLSSSEIIS